VSDSWAVDNPHQISHWKQRDPFEVWSLYFDLLTEAAESGLFNIIGHADLPKKFGIIPEQDCTPLFERFLQAAQQNGLAVELNTAGLRKECRAIYPGEPFCRLMRQYDIPITFGSDAHATDEVGLNWPEAIELAQKCGYTHWTRFSQRQSQPIPLGSGPG
jgi:histidinol-phosphatase (PHP family)